MHFLHNVISLCRSQHTVQHLQRLSNAKCHCPSLAWPNLGLMPKDHPTLQRQEGVSYWAQSNFHMPLKNKNITITPVLEHVVMAHPPSSLIPQ
jgi:hypothetical protein